MYCELNTLPQDCIISPYLPACPMDSRFACSLHHQVNQFPKNISSSPSLSLSLSLTLFVPLSISLALTLYLSSLYLFLSVSFLTYWFCVSGECTAPSALSDLILATSHD